MERGERSAVISGIGQSQIGRRLGRSDLSLTLEAVTAALDDAGLDRSEVDGLAGYAGQVMGPRPGGFNGMHGTSLAALHDALRLDLRWWSGSNEGPGQYVGLFNAIAAVAAGLARHVVVFRTQTEASVRQAKRNLVPPPEEYGPPSIDDWLLPMRVASSFNWVALFAQRYFDQYGMTREQLAQIALTARHNASLNPAAVYRTPLTIDDYFDAPMMSTPLCLLDCDIPVDGSTAIGTGLGGRTAIDQFDDMTKMGVYAPARTMWSRTDLCPSDVDIAYLYDGYSFIVVPWLEALGFCAHGEAGAFLEGGTRISLHGELPLNTDGGHLSAGRTHGFGYLVEACQQFRGTCGDRQVADPEVAVIATGGGTSSQGCLLVTSAPNE